MPEACERFPLLQFPKLSFEPAPGFLCFIPPEQFFPGGVIVPADPSLKVMGQSQDYNRPQPPGLLPVLKDLKANPPGFCKNPKQAGIKARPALGNSRLLPFQQAYRPRMHQDLFCRFRAGKRQGVLPYPLKFLGVPGKYMAGPAERLLPAALLIQVAESFLIQQGTFSLILPEAPVFPVDLIAKPGSERAFHGTVSFQRFLIDPDLPSCAAGIRAGACRTLKRVIIIGPHIPHDPSSREFFLSAPGLYSPSSCSSQIRAQPSLGIRRSPRGDTATEPTFGPSGRQERLNCWAKNLR